MKIIKHYLNFRPTAEWIKSFSGIPYLNINLDVPSTAIYNEWCKVQHLAVEHRSEESISQKFFYGHNNWKSLVLYGRHYTATSDDTKPMDWTEISEQCPFTVKWITDNFKIDDTTGRIRFMYLGPNGYILPHKDRDHKRLAEFNIAITNPKGCMFRLTHYGNVPFEQGKIMMIDISNEHLVFNASDQPRLHIIVHGNLRDETLIERSYADRYNS